MKKGEHHSFSHLFFSPCSYEPVHAKIVRHFEKRNVTREDPQAYVTRYGTQLYDSNLVVQQARSVGVLEDLVRMTVPAAAIRPSVDLL